ncbi:Casein kinase I isoform epsilon [Branchiostoma belcheri]|nr:Casein kinase I isoform epsilon [Branchiostoma belcheri]
MRNCKLCSGWSLRIPRVWRAAVCRRPSERSCEWRRRGVKIPTVFITPSLGPKQKRAKAERRKSSHITPEASYGSTFAERKRVGTRERWRHDGAINIVEAHQEVVGDSWRTKLCITENEPDWRNKT